ncbi:hypothetical protein [Vibrio sp.]|uniref:hypothetical protein n=1 Tax=Vibrio sp. TaxID=678 RepID=UPI003D105D47
MVVIMFVLMIVCLTILPSLLTRCAIEILKFARNILKLAYQLMLGLLKGLKYVFVSTPTSVLADIWASTRYLSTAYKTSYQDNKIKVDRRTRFQAANRKRSKVQQSRKLAADAFDTQFHQFSAQLTTLQEKHQRHLSLAAAINPLPSDLDIPTFLRRGVFQTNGQNQLVRDEDGFPVKVSVAGMFRKPNKPTAEAQPDQDKPKPKPKADVMMTEPPVLDDDGGFEPAYDPCCDIPS